MDPAVLNNLVKCTQLSLSSNCIEKMVNLPNMRNLEILSLAIKLITLIKAAMMER